MVVSFIEFINVSDVVIDRFYYHTDEEFMKVFGLDLNNKRVYICGNILLNCIQHLSKFKNMDIIIHNTDKTIDDLSIQPLLPFCNKIYSINCIVNYKNVKKIPLGITTNNKRVVNEPWYNNIPFNNELYLNADKSKISLCYLNFNKYDHINELQFVFVKQSRLNCYNELYTKSFIDVETSKLCIEDYVKKLARYKFSPCPIGFGIDTHRFYECVILGVRPIVLKSSLDDMYKHFNPLIVDNWNDITEELLISQPEYKIPYDALEAKFWIN